MIFNVSDDFNHRSAVILGMLDSGPPGIAVISAASDLEWTLRRAIVALGKNPNVEIHRKIERTSGLRVYAKQWKMEVGDRFKVDLESLIPEWDNFVDNTYKLRHKLIHGAITNTTTEYARPRVEEILRATKSVVDFAGCNGVNLYSRLPVRRKAWTPE
jgi:hypothetical protein